MSVTKVRNVVTFNLILFIIPIPLVLNDYYVSNTKCVMQLVSNMATTRFKCRNFSELHYVFRPSDLM